VHPVLVELWGVSVRSHEFFVALGVALAGLVVWLEARRRRLVSDGLLVAVAAGLIGGALGMRAAGLVRSLDPTHNPPLAAAWQYGAKSILGGLTGAYVGVLVGKRLAGYRTPTGDVFAPAVALGMAVGRIGCLLTEPPGRPTSLPWGVRLTADQLAGVAGCTGCRPGVPMHPSFGYEIAFHLLALVALVALRSRIAVPGGLLTLYLAGYATLRFGVEFVRVNDVVALGLTRGQWFLLAVLPLLAWKAAGVLRAGRAAGGGPDGDPDGDGPGGTARPPAPQYSPG